MTEFMQKECYRLIDKLAETDPTTEAYHIVLSSIERLDAIGTTIDEIAKMRETRELTAILRPDVIANEVKEQFDEILSAPGNPFTKGTFPAEVKQDVVKEDSATTEPVNEEKTYEAAEVRRALVSARGRGVDVKAILSQVGADNFTAVPEAKYSEVMDALAEALEAL